MAYDVRYTVLPPYQEHTLEQYPQLAGHYGEIPQPFIAAIKERTGFEGYELQDYLDQLIYEVFEGWDFAGWKRLQYEIVAAAKKRLATFRTYLAIAMMCLIALPIIIPAFTAGLSAATTSASMGLSLVGKISLFAQVFVGSLSLGFNAFLVAIRFQTLIGVHKIALLVSAEYRLTMSKVYGEIRKVSSALGYGPEFLLLLTQNSKKLIQDVGSTFGREWDMTEVQWLATFQDYMGKFQGAAYKYRDNPEAVLFDLSRWVEEPAVNAKGAFMAKLVENVDDTVKKTGEIVGDIVTVKEDINKLVMDLPEEISKKIADAIEPYIAKFDTFIIDTYDPYKRELDEIIAGIKSLQGSQRSRMTDLVDRLRKPGDYLLEIDSLSDEEREDQELKMDYISSSYYRRHLAGVSEVVSPIDAELRKIAAIKTRPLELAFMGVEEVTAPAPIPIGEIDPAKTWFVGEY